MRLPHLIERADRRDKDNGIGFVKIGHPTMPLSSRATYVVEVPSDRSAMQRNFEKVLRHAHGLNASVENVIYNQSTNGK
jgi:hypothetical protein